MLKQELDDSQYFPPDESGYWLSPSMIMAYKTCPYQFERQYILRVKLPPSTPMLKGRIFHSFVDHFYDIVDVAYLMNLPQKEVAPYFRSLFPFGTTLDEWYERFARFESRRWKLVSTWDWPDRYFLPYKRELYLQNTRLKLFGTVDRIDRTRRGGFEILDYKSKPGNLSDLRRQLCHYTILVNNANPPIVPIPVARVNAYFYHTGTVFSERLGKPTWDALIRWIKKTRKAMREEEFPRNIGEHCNWCGFFTHCLNEVDFDDLYSSING